MLTSDDLTFFQTVASHQSLAGAARTLHVTPPSVTQRLQGIERRLGLKLVIRQGRGIALTGEGRVLAERGRAILADLEALHDALKDRKDELVGRLTVLAPVGVGAAYIAPLAARFKSAHPGLTVDIHLSDNPAQASSQDWDLMIHIGELRDSRLRRTVLARNKRFLCASPAYLARAGTPADAGALRNHACIALRENAEDVTLWRLRAPGASQERAVRIEPALASNDGRVVKQWGLDGHGIILRSEWDVAPELRDGRLVRVLPRLTLPSADIVALMPDAPSRRSARTRHFLAYLKAELSPALWLGS